LGGGSKGSTLAQRSSSSKVRRTGRYLRGRTVPSPPPEYKR
jgi:hypothetical protein